MFGKKLSEKETAREGQIVVTCSWYFDKPPDWYALDEDERMEHAKGELQYYMQECADEDDLEQVVDCGVDTVREST